MSIRHIVILGAGPCGLSTAIALSKLSALNSALPPLKITLVEVRPQLQTIGGTVNLTPIAIRYLDYLGAGKQLRDNSIALDTGVDAISLRTGWRLGNVWGGVGARRTARYALVRSLFDTINRDYSNSVKFLWGKRVTKISEVNDQVQLNFEDQSTLESDILLGCDGIHSAARHLWVEPTREKAYSGRAVTMGWAYNAANQAKNASPSPITMPGGQPALRDTAAFSTTGGTMIASFYEPSRQNIFVAHVRKMAEQNVSGVDGWQLLGKNQEAVRKEVIDVYSGGRINGLQETIASCEDWHVYPIYALPPKGIWHKGRVLLLGDAAHAMPPQGESTGLAIEDGILLARVLTQRPDSPVDRSFAVYESARKEAIDQHFKDAQKMGKMVSSKPPGILGILLDIVIMVFMFIKKRQKIDHFKGDVREIDVSM